MTTLNPRFITALATPMDANDTLLEQGLEAQIAQQLAAGIRGLLVGGTMGAMQLLTDETYRKLMVRTLDFAAGRTEIMAGAGDTSFARTRDRILFLNTLPVDGVVVLTPYLMPFSQAELVDYFCSLADISRAPMYLYDLPQTTHLKVDLETARSVAKHPNIRGIKCSDEPGYARQLHDELGDRFRVILSAPLLTDVFLRYGMAEHLDGIYCVCPRQIVALGRAAEAGDWTLAAQIQQGLTALLAVLKAHGVWGAFTCLMNEIGVPGRFKPRPHRSWSDCEMETFWNDSNAQAAMRFLRQ